MLTGLFALWVMYKSIREKREARAGAGSVGSDALLVDERHSWRDRMESLPRLAPFLVLIVIVMVALYGGWATPSEVAGIGAFGALVMVMLIYGCWRWSDLKVILSGTARESSMIMLIIAMSFLYTYVMSYMHVTQEVAHWLVSLEMGKWQFFFWTNVLLIVLGFFLPPVAIILMVTPIILPALQALGIDLIWFGVIMTILMEMGLIHPPIGLNLFVISGIAPDIPLKDIIWGVVPFLVLMVVGIILLCIFPEIALWLPSRYKGS